MTVRRPDLTTCGMLLTALLVFPVCTAAQTSSPALTTLYNNFGGSPDGSGPSAGVVIGSGGVLYSTTRQGGSGPCQSGVPPVTVGCGTVFSLTPPSSPGGAWTEEVLYKFSGANLPAFTFPSPSTLVIGRGGVLYGTTTNGGTGSCGGTGCGTVFSLAPPSSPGGAWTEKVLHNFRGGASDGSNPEAGVRIGKAGVLFGTTMNGGSGSCGGPGCGTVFSLAPPSTPGGAWTERVLHRFKGASDGSNPAAGVVLGSGGVLYGTTAYGGDTGNGGTVFSLTPPTSPGGAWTENVLYRFMGGTSDGYGPGASVVIGSGGVLYGTTAAGGTGSFCGGCGTVFSLTPPPSPGGAWTEKVLHNFDFPNDGYSPSASVVIGKGGTLYGTTYYGGTGSCQGASRTPGCGSLYAVAPPSSPGGSWTEAVLHNFMGDTSEGAYPAFAVVIGSGGVLYGTTYTGGAGPCTTVPFGPTGCGTVFSLKP